MFYFPQTIPGCGLRCKISHLEEIERSSCNSPLVQDRVKSTDLTDKAGLLSQVVIDTSMMKPTLVSLNTGKVGRSSIYK